MLDDIELSKMLSDLKRLPARDRKAIERQLSGLDKMNVKKMMTSRSAERGNRTGMQGKASSDPTGSNEGIITHDLQQFSPELAKCLNAILSTENDSLDARADRLQTKLKQLLPDLIDDPRLPGNSVLITSPHGSEKSGSFKAVLARLSRRSA